MKRTKCEHYGVVTIRTMTHHCVACLITRFAIGHLGLHVAANGSLSVYGTPVALPAWEIPPDTLDRESNESTDSHNRSGRDQAPPRPGQAAGAAAITPNNSGTKSAAVVVPIPAAASEGWPADLRGLALGGINVAGRAGVTVACNLTSASVAALRCEVSVAPPG